MSLLEYSKMILEKMAFYPQLFKKELRKAMQKLDRDEARKLINWIRNHTNKTNKTE